MYISIVWFRRDLRIQNNPALEYAIRHGGQVLPVYIDTSGMNTSWQQGSASRWWCHQSLEHLEKALKQQGLKLYYFRGNPSKVIASLIEQTGATTVTWNRLYEPQETELESDVKKLCKHVDIKEFDSNVLFIPGNLLNKTGQAYRVFTPFWKEARRQLEISGVSLTKTRKYNLVSKRNMRLEGECSLSQLRLLDKHPWHKKLHQYWTPGEKSAQAQLKKFIKNAIEDYETDRDFPAIAGTSRLSAHLHFGEITPSQIIYQLQQYEYDKNTQKTVERFITELGWREFAHHVLWHFPFTVERCMNEKFDKFWPTRASKKLLTAWQTGNTGVPLVDAGMRQLWETGWMHNRVRMIVGSFLTKNMGMHWLHGARWFWDTLVDADLANNTLGWQWVAGCGVDAAPYYRIFNPDTQARRFDPDLTYIKQWVAEIDELGCVPIIDISNSREAALMRYREYKPG